MTQRTDLLVRITRFNRGRDPERLALKYKKMQKDAHAFLRGTCHLFYADWPQSLALDDAPLVWLCGDLHMENFGTYRGDNRLVYFDIADFDEALLAPSTWDLGRLLTSALIAARVHGFKRKDGVALCSAFLDSYCGALRDGKARWIERAVARGLIRRALRRLDGATRRAFIAERTMLTQGRESIRIDGRRTLPIDKEDRRRVTRFMKAFAADQDDRKFFKLIDVARRIAGTGSLGLERYAILVNAGGKRSTRVLLDLKFAPASALAPYAKFKQPRWESDAARVVSVQRRAQAIAPAFLQCVSIGSRSYVLRELMPTLGSVNLSEPNVDTVAMEQLARDLGVLVAWSELRSGGREGSATIDELGAFAQEKRWRRSLTTYAEHYANTTWNYWKLFREAYRDGAIEP